jgi:ferredoxin, 2Fe-2S
MLITLHFETATGQLQTVHSKVGRTVMQAAVDAGLEGIAADCGGCLSCATCHVWVAQPWLDLLPPATPDEMAMLEMTAVPRQAGSRLSCQVTLTPALQGLTVQLPATQY